MSLNKRLMKLYNIETACQATYQKDGSTFHTLKYVDWLEERTTKLEELAQQHLTQAKRFEDSQQILREFYEACMKADDEGDLSYHIDWKLLERAKLLLA